MSLLPSTKLPSDAEWVRRLKAQDAVAEELLWELLFRFAYHAAYRRGQSEDLARDAATQSLERLLLRGGLSRYEFRAAFKTYCYQIVVHEVLRLIPRQIRVEQLTAPVDEDLPAPPDYSPETLDLESCLAQLPPREQRILRLCYELEMSPGDVAEELGLTRNHVHQLAHRARKKLRDCLEK